MSKVLWKYSFYKTNYTSQFCMFSLIICVPSEHIGRISEGYWSSENGNRLANQLNTFSYQSHVSPALCTLLISKSMVGLSGVYRLEYIAQVIGEKKHPCTPGSSTVFFILICSIKAAAEVSCT